MLLKALKKNQKNTMKVTIEPDILFQELDNELVLLNLVNEQYFGLDPIGSRMWQLLEQHKQTSLVVKQICLEYDVNEEQASQDLNNLVTKLADAKLIRINK